MCRCHPTSGPTSSTTAAAARRVASRLLAVAALTTATIGSVGPSPPTAYAESPTKKPPVEIVFNEVYAPGTDDERKCDVYLPGDAAASKRPVVVVVHGGGWSGGDKFSTSGHCRALARQGYVAININYRLAPKHKFPVQVDDVRQALIWTVDQAERFDLDTDRIGMFGYSAGGHLSALVSLLGDEPIETQQRASTWTNDDPRWSRIPKVRAVCVGGPPCDFRELPASNTTLAYFLGGSRGEYPDLYDVASPVSHASPGDPPLQIIHGETDAIVSLTGSRLLEKALRSCGVDCRYKEIPGQGHLLTFIHPETRATMLEFFADALRSPMTAPRPPLDERQRAVAK